MNKTCFEQQMNISFDEDSQRRFCADFKYIYVISED